MKTEQETIDHAIVMLQALKDGKKVVYVGCQDIYEEIKNVRHLFDVLGWIDEIAIAPEPKEYWLVVGKDDSPGRFETKAEAEATRIRWNSKFPAAAPHTVEHYVQVMP